MNDVQLCEFIIKTAVDLGADKVRVTLNRDTEDIVATLDSGIDKVTRCEDSSVSINLFANGRYGNFSTNRLDDESLRTFISRAMDIVGSLSPDEFRNLPEPGRCCKDAVSGDELDLYDISYPDAGSADRIRTALEACVTHPKIVSKEGEYSESLSEVLVMDSQGLLCRHRETNFDYGVEITVEDGGEKYSGYWWDSSSRRGGLDAAACGRRALESALAQAGSAPVSSRRCNMVVRSDIASKMVSPLLRALNAYSLQQQDSFLIDSLGRKIFHEGMTLVDDPHIPGQCCSKLFDSEGVATRPMCIIGNGVVRTYFINTYMAAKMGTEPTVEDAVRPHLMPWPSDGMNEQDIIRLCGDGILVTEFNGGNSNSSTGDFSYGFSGFEFKDGVIVRPVSEMLVTGNFITLWNNLIAAGSDHRPCMSKLIPTLAFSNVDFNGN